jgi:hypothetical protein
MKVVATAPPPDHLTDGELAYSPFKFEGHLSYLYSSSQTRTPFGTTRIDDFTTRLGAHTCTESMGALALYNTGLKCSLHNIIRSIEAYKKRLTIPAKSLLCQDFILHIFFLGVVDNLSKEVYTPHSSLLKNSYNHQ